MAMVQQHWETRVPTSLFEETQYEADQLFYATFPAARDAVCNAAFERNVYELPSPMDYQILHEAAEPLEYDIRNGLDISSTSTSFRGPTQDLPCPQLHSLYSEELHRQQPFPPHHYIEQSYYSPRPIENEAPLYIPPNYYHQHSSEATSQHIPHSHPGPVSAQKPACLVYTPSNTSSQVSTSIQETVNDGRPETPRYNFRQLNCHMKPPTLKFSNNCQFGVMRLHRLSDRGDLEFTQLSHQSYQCPSEASAASPVTPSPSTPPPTEFLLNSAPSPSIGLSSLPPKITPEKKPPLACLFCRGRKIACGAPLPGSIKKTCNQCRKRGLTCSYPIESRRGMRKKKLPSEDQEGDAEVVSKSKKKKK